MQASQRWEVHQDPEVSWIESIRPIAMAGFVLYLPFPAIPELSHLRDMRATQTVAHCWQQFASCKLLLHPALRCIRKGSAYPFITQLCVMQHCYLDHAQNPPLGYVFSVLLSTPGSHSCLFSSELLLYSASKPTEVRNTLFPLGEKHIKCFVQQPSWQDTKVSKSYPFSDCDVKADVGPDLL